MSKEFFRGVAGKWDEIRKTMYTDEVRNKAIESCKLEQGQRAVDVGAGTGFVTEALLERGVPTVAVDHSFPMLEQLRKKFTNSNLLNIKIGTGERIPLLANRFDAALANMSLHHAENPDKMIIEMTRVLKPGGRMAITDLDAHKYEWLRDEHHDRWMGFDRKDVEKWLKEAGLTEVRVAAIAGEACSAKAPDGKEVKVGIFLATAQKPTTPSMRTLS
ncbi:MAG TPA: class I SAM-dependent methyltransferase [Candidatus Thermoplasmatota archaeon]|nr:class I SAM-dependent methyltransferase [Candidatus Thermoplasmatota archaeon]